MLSMHFGHLVALFLAVAPVSAQVTTLFEFQTSIRLKTKTLNAISYFGVEVTEIDPGHLRFHFNRNCRVLGLNQDSFSYVREQFSGDLQADRWKLLLEEAHKLPLEELKKGKSEASIGTLIFEDATYRIPQDAGAETIEKWQKSLESFVRTLPVDWTLGTTTFTMEGATVKPVDVTIAQIVETPERYDGKRVRIEAIYRNGMEQSAFGPLGSEKSASSEEIWFGGVSMFFADSMEFALKNGSYVKVVGTFSNKPGSKGHMGAYVGGLELVTSIHKLPEPGSH